MEKMTNHSITFLWKDGRNIRKEVSDKDYGSGESNAESKSVEALCSLNIGFDTLTDLKKKVEMLSEDQFVECVETIKDTVKSVVKFSLENTDMVVSVGNPVKIEEPIDVKEPVKKGSIQDRIESKETNTNNDKYDRVVANLKKMGFKEGKKFDDTYSYWKKVGSAFWNYYINPDALHEARGTLKDGNIKMGYNDEAFPDDFKAIIRFNDSIIGEQEDE